MQYSYAGKFFIPVRCNNAVTIVVEKQYLCIKFHIYLFLIIPQSMNNIRFLISTLLWGCIHFSYAQDAANAKNQGIMSYDLTISAPPIFSQLSSGAQAGMPMETHHKVNVYFADHWRRYEDSTLVRRSNGKYSYRYKNAEAGWLVNTDDKMFYLMHQIDGKIYYSEDVLNSQRWRFTLSIYDADTSTSTKFQRIIPRINDFNALTVTDEYKDIMGYKCRKATYKTDFVQLDGVKDNDGIELWYTDALPTNISPMPCGVVNGAILELKAHRYYYKATGVKFQSFDETHVALPKDGIKLTIAAEEKLIDKAMK